MKILVPITYGSELRQFFHSGLVEKLIAKGHEVFTIIKNEESGIMDEIPPQVTFLQYPTDNHLGILFNALHTGLNKSNHSSFQFDPIPIKKGLKGFFYNAVVNLIAYLGKFSKFRYVLKLLETQLVRSQKKTEWIQLLSRNSIETVVLNVPNSHLACLSSANRLKIKRILIFHTHKDLQVIDRIIIPYDGYGVWNQNMKNHLIEKLKITSEVIQITGNLHLSFLMKNALTSEPSDSKKPKFLYICGALNISNEEIILQKIIALLNQVFHEDFHLTVRKNPMEIRDIWEKYQSTQVQVVTPKWYYNMKNNYNFARKNDLSEFKQQLDDADAIIGFPSSVILEANLMGKDFINLLIDEKDVLITNSQSSPSKLWENALYHQIKIHQACINIYHFDDLIEKLKDYPQKKRTYNMAYLKDEIGIVYFDELIEKNINLIIG